MSPPAWSMLPWTYSLFVPSFHGRSSRYTTFPSRVHARRDSSSAGRSTCRHSRSNASPRPSATRVLAGVSATLVGETRLLLPHSSHRAASALAEGHAPLHGRLRQTSMAPSRRPAGPTPRQATLTQQRRGPAEDPGRQARQVRVARRRQWVEHGAAGAGRQREVFIHEQGVEVRVASLRRVEALHRDDRSWASALDAVTTLLAALQSEARAHEDPVQLAEEIQVARHWDAQFEGQAQDELPHGHVREHPVQQPGGGVGPAPTGAGGARAAALVGQSDQLVSLAAGAVGRCWSGPMRTPMH